MTDPSPSTSFLPGDVVAGKYRVDRVLGEGGMGVVLAATHVHLDQKVALKFLLPAFSENKEVVERFLREGRAAVKIQSEHVARVLDVGATDTGAPYMVMEYLEGEDLAQLVTRRGPLPVDESVGYVLEACEAIAEAHALGIVHRDLKPANLFVARRSSGRPIVKVLDFGISKVTSATKDANLTKTSALLGSPLYMSPEQLVAAPTVDPRADLWALGIVLYEMLTGQLPFLADTMPELVGAILMKPHAPVDVVRSDVPPGLKDAIENCLQKEPIKRFANVAELARAIAPFGPARGAQSVERIEHLLGVVSDLSQTNVSAPSPMGATAVRPSPAEGRTLSPATSQAQPRATRYVALPLGIGGIGIAAVLFFVFRGQPHAAPIPALASPPVASVSPSSAAIPSTSPNPVDAVSASASVPATTAATLPAATKPEPPGSPGKSEGRSHRRSPPQPSATPPAPSSSGCRVVSYYDADGAKHFKQDCR